MNEILLVGDEGVGKKLLFNVMLMNNPEQYTKNQIETMIYDSMCHYPSRSIVVDNTVTTFRILEYTLSAPSPFTAFGTFRQGDIYYFMYSIDSRQSFDKITSYKKQLETEKDGQINDFAVILVATKCDLRINTEPFSLMPSTTDYVTKEEGEQLAKELDVPFFEISALNLINVAEAIKEGIRVCRIKYKIRCQKEEEEQKFAHSTNNAKHKCAVC